MILGTRLGPYEVLSLLGAGGMGEVYRAKDATLKREVALKVLPADVAKDRERLARFQREAEVLASLNHPHIAQIYGLEHAGDTFALVMELVEGEDLAQRIARGPIPLDEALPIARQIAEALEAAHEHRIIHRDLKPANIKVRSDGTVKVLDFGLAKAVDPSAGSGATAVNSPTLSIHATQAGIILGTAAYMSPEQARGKAVDRRTDIWALGCVLFEMLSGMRAFPGEDATDTVVAVVSKEPDWTALPSLAPPGILRLLRRSLEKEPKRRLDSAAGVRIEIDDASKAQDLSSPSKPPRRRLVVAGGALLFFVAGAALSWLFSRPGEPGQPPPPALTFNRLTLQPGLTRDPAVSPDGKWVLYANPLSGNQDIYLQSTSGQSTVNLTKDSPANDSMPAFSPDGDSIAFRSERDGGGLFVMGRTGDSVRRLTSSGFHPAWFPDGRRIVFATQSVLSVEARSEVSELWIVDASGGEPRRLFAGDAVQPRVSPNGQRIAFWSLPADGAQKRFTGSNRDLWTVQADGASPVRVLADEAYEWNPIWSPDGRWLYFLSNRSASMNLWRIAIDEGSGAASGPPQPLTAPAPYIRQFSLSADGRVGTYATLTVTGNIARVPFDPRTATVRGPLEPITTGPRDFGQLDISPDGEQIVVATSGRQQEDLFLMASDGTGLRQLTHDAARDRGPRWLPDGRRIAFFSDRTGGYNAWTIDRDGSSLRQLTKSKGRLYPLMSRDGSVLAIGGTGDGIYMYDAKDLTRPPALLPAIPPTLGLGTGSVVLDDWSPDGRLLVGSAVGAFVYSLDQQEYRKLAGGPAQSLNWLPDGRRLLFARQGRLHVADWTAGEATQVFAIPGEAVNTPRLTRDGSYVYFVHGTASGDIWMVRFDDGSSATKQ